MADAALSFDTAFAPHTGQPVTVGRDLVRLTAPNAGPYTFKGTNSFLLGSARLVVVDPGPRSDAHLGALLAAIDGRPVEAILLTHTHKDHCGNARALRAATGAPLWFGGRHRTSRPRRLFEINAVAAESDWRLEPDRVLQDGEVLPAGSGTITVLATPGHCANHLCFGLESGDLLSGDHVMGWSSTLVPVPDGSMRDYLASLEKLIALPYRRYLPAHGGEIGDGAAYARALLGHRRARNAQIVDAVAKGADSIGALLRSIYPRLSLTLIPAARMTLAAHIEYLEARKLLIVRRRPWGPKLLPGTQR